MDLILASASPRRYELLTQIGVSARVVPADIDETPLKDEPAADYVLRLAEQKALAVFTGLNAKVACLGSDTSVVKDGKILGKPTDFDDARQMLLSLSGSAHEVLTAVALATEQGVDSCLVSTQVWFRNISESEILAYWASNEPRDKAGAYGIQGFGAVFVDRIEGSYSAVVGLPLAETSKLLKAAGVPIWQLPIND